MSGTQASTSSQAATPGNWITQTINGMQYDVLLPANYDPSVKYPTMLYLHQLDMGTDPSGLMAEVNPWFNTAAFRASTPAIIVMPLLDQSADPSGQTINFGGVSTNDNPGETNAIAALKQVMSQYSTDSSRVYVTGNSLGGIGTEDMLIKFNAYTGTEDKIFAAALSLAGSDYGQGYPQPNASVVSALQNVPFWAIHGGQDTTVPITWDQNLYAAEQAIGGAMKFTQDNSLGHDVWDTYYPQTGASSPLGWLFSQSTGGSTPPPPPPPPPAVTASANDTAITSTTAAITDASGNKWTITSGGQVAINGTTDVGTSGVKELAYVNGTIWQENTSNLWWGETQNNDAWAPAAGTATSPLPAPPTPSANNTAITSTTAAITDASGNKWTITSGGQVAINGTTDVGTSGVKELAYVNGTIWQENTSNLWWGETQNNDAWAPGPGTATSPLPSVTTSPPPTTPSPNDTTITGTTAAITDAHGNKWTITSGGQVAINGTTDVGTSGVKELAYVNGTIWQENNANLWWGETQNNDAWAPGPGTATSPLPSITTTPPPSGVVGSGSDTIVLTMSEDADGPAGAAGRDAEFTLNVDGKQIGGLQTVTASHAGGQTQTFTFQGNYAPGMHAITITFANNSMTAGDKAAFNDGGDRNVYVNSVTYDGAAVSSTVTGIYQSPFYAPLNTGAPVYGNTVYTVTDSTIVPASAPSTPTTTPATVSAGSGADTLTLAMSEDPYLGDAQFTVSVDGKQVGGTLTTSAVEWQGQSQQFVLHGSWGTGQHTVSIAFLNDLIGPPDARGTYDSVDRNLVVNSISYDGTTTTAAPYVLSNNGSRDFNVPATTPPKMPVSPNNTMVLAGSTNAIVDASNNTWTITSGGQVAVNGVADTTTAGVAELAYVGTEVWQENTGNVWWGKTSPAASWAPGAGTATSPLPAPVSIASGTTSAIVNQSQVSVVATTGSHMLFLGGSNDVVSLTGGANTVIDTGHGNTYLLPAAGKGTDTFTNNILNQGDTFDLKTALAATNWNGTASTVSKYLTVTDSAKGATLSIAPTSGGTAVAVATINGATTLTPPSLLAHVII